MKLIKEKWETTFSFKTNFTKCKGDRNMNNGILKMKQYNEIIAMIKMFFVFFGGASIFFIFALFVELIA